MLAHVIRCGTFPKSPMDGAQCRCVNDRVNHTKEKGVYGQRASRFASHMGLQPYSTEGPAAARVHGLKHTVPILFKDEGYDLVDTVPVLDDYDVYECRVNDLLKKVEIKLQIFERTAAEIKKTAVRCNNTKPVVIRIPIANSSREDYAMGITRCLYIAQAIGLTPSRYDHPR